MKVFKSVSNYLFLTAVLIGGMTTRVISIPSLGKQLSFYLTEPLILVLCAAAVLLGLRSFIRRVRKDGALLDAAVAAIVFCLYVIITRIVFTMRGFDSDIFIMPRTSLVLICSFLIFCILPVFSSDEKLAAILSYFMFFTGRQIGYFMINGTLRMSLIGENINFYVCALIMILPTVLRRAGRSKFGDMRLWYIILALGMMLMIFPTGSRAGVAIVALIFVSFIVREIVKKNWKLVFTFLSAFFCAILIVGTLFVFGSDNVKMDIARGFGIEKQVSAVMSGTDTSKTDVSKADKIKNRSSGEKSNALRFELWKMAVDEIKKAPAFGSGRVSIKFKSDKINYNQGAHNMILELLMTYGIVGTLLYLVMLCLMLRWLLRRHEDKFTVLLTVGVFCAFSMVEPTFVSLPMNALFVMTLSVDAEKKKKPKMVGE